MMMWPTFFAIPYPQIDPVFLRLGPLQFRWYGLMYLLSLLAAYFVIKARAAARRIPLTKEQIYDMIVYAAVGVFVGGRLGYTFFYNFSYYIQNPLKIFAVWEGGMSFHGGLVGTIIALWLFSKKRGIPAGIVADLAAGTTPIGLFLGRIGNFINGELYGRVTDVDWCMVFPTDGPVCRHPSQLYETALEGVLLFGVLSFISRMQPPPWTVFWSFITGYGLCRMVVEFFREPDAHLGFVLGPLSMGQLLSLPMVLIGAVMLALTLRGKPAAAAKQQAPRQPRVKG